MSLRKQIIKERVTQIAKQLNITEDKSFLRFACSLITNQGLHDFENADLVDGGQDKQIDLISIFEEDEEATIHILQSTQTDSFSSNKLIHMRNGLDWIFSKPKSDLNALSNIPFRDKIYEFRSLQNKLGPSNINIIVSFVTIGDSSRISKEFHQEEKTINEKFNNNTYCSFVFKAWGCDELVERMNALEKHDRKIDADIKIKYDANNPSLIRYHAEGLKGIVCTTTAKEIANVVNDDSSGNVFEMNVRRFLGTRGAVNSDILNTCTSNESSHLFWFLNNGLTIVCDSCDYVTDPDNPIIKLKNMQIVNGCQTATALALAEKKNNLLGDTRVLLRIYETNDQDLISKIVLTTNNQNKITSRDLRANDPIQIDMENAFRQKNYYYERKPRQYDNDNSINTSRIVTNEYVGQSYLGIVLKKPSDARRRKYKVWGELYNQVFSGGIIEPYIISVLISRRTNKRLSKHEKNLNEIKRKIANNGVFHISRIVSYLWRKNDNWTNVAKLRKNIIDLEKNPSYLDPYINTAFKIMFDIIKNTPLYSGDIDAALKSNNLDTEINKELYTRAKTIKNVEK